MIFKDYYKILNLESSKITPQELKIAYREAAKKYHPDININDQFAEERFKDINEAYRVLSNSTSKRKYDRIWNNNVGKRRSMKRAKGRMAQNFPNFSQCFLEILSVRRKNPTIK